MEKVLAPFIYGDYVDFLTTYLSLVHVITPDDLDGTGRNCGLLAEIFGVYGTLILLLSYTIDFAAILIWYQRFVAAMVLLQHTVFLVYHIGAICWFSMLEILLFVSLLSFYLRRQIGENGVVLCVVMLLLHYAVIWFYHGLNSVVAMLLFTIVLLRTSLILALVFVPTRPRVLTKVNTW